MNCFSDACNQYCTYWFCSSKHCVLHAVLQVTSGHSLCLPTGHQDTLLPISQHICSCRHKGCQLAHMQQMYCIAQTADACHIVSMTPTGLGAGAGDVQDAAG